MKIMKNILYIFGIICFTSTSMWAGGPWPKPKGKAYFKLSQWWTVFDQHYTDTGKLDPNSTTGVFNTSFYGEYGITNRFTAIANVPLFSRNYMNNQLSRTTRETLIEGEALNSIGDIDLGIKYGLTKQNARFPVAVSLFLGLPTGSTNGGTQKNLQTGDGEFNQMLQVDAGTGFNIGNNSAYASVYSALNNRSNGFSEEFRYGFELGIGLLNEQLWIATRLNAVESFKNGDTAETITSTSIFANNSEFISLGIEVNYYVTKHIGVSVGTAGAFRGEIIAAAPSYSVGVFYDLK